MPCLPKAFALYLNHLAKRLKTSSIQRAMAAIAKAHTLTGYTSPRRDPLVQQTWRSIRNAIGCEPVAKKAIVVDGIQRLIATCDLHSLRGLRDRAIILLGSAGAFRRSELVALDVQDLEDDACGMRVRLQRPAAYQVDDTCEKGIPFGDHEVSCPVYAVKAWISAAHLEQGPLFVSVNRHGMTTGLRLHGRDVARTVQRAGLACGFDTSRLAGHSLRSGLVTAAAIAGKSERDIMRQSGHVSIAMVRRYIKRAHLFDNNAADGIGL